MTRATSKCICGVQPPENDLTTIFVCYFLHVRSSVACLTDWSCIYIVWSVWHVPVYIHDKAANSILVKPALHHFFNLTCTYLSQKQETRNVVLTQYFQYIC